MRRYDILVDPFHAEPAERISMQAPGAGSLFGWAQRHAAGRRFEIFENGGSLGGATYDGEAGLWTIFPSSGRVLTD
jgi:hypothetical protein